MDMSKIFVPIDGSKKSFEALDRALMLTGFTHGEVTCVHVIPHVQEGGSRTKTFDNHLKEDAEIILKKAQKYAENKNVKLKTKILRGSPSHETLTVTKNSKSDHIVMSTTGSGSAKEDVLGSVSNQILHKSKISRYLIK